MSEIEKVLEKLSTESAGLAISYSFGPLSKNERDRRHNKSIKEAKKDLSTIFINDLEGLIEKSTCRGSWYTVNVEEIKALISKYKGER